MKASFIHFGQVKNYDKTQHKQFTKLISPAFSNVDLDYYLITTNSNKYVNPRQNEKNQINPLSITNFFDYKQVIFDDIPNKVDELNEFAEYLVKGLKHQAWGKHSMTSTFNSLKQIYSLNYFYNSFKDQIDNYDFFVLARSDLFYIDRLTLPQLIENNIYVPNWGHFSENSRIGGCNDRFCIITSKQILELYCSRYNLLKESPEKYHAERYLRDQLLKNNIRCKVIKSFHFRLLRSNNIISSFIGDEPDIELTNEYYEN